MKAYEDICSWMQSNNPFLYCLAEEKIELNFSQKQVRAPKDAEVVVLNSVDQFDYQSLLDENKVVVIVESDEKKLFSFLHDPSFRFEKNLFILFEANEQMLFVAKKLLWKNVYYTDEETPFKAVFEQVCLNLSEYRDFGKSAIANIAGNLLDLDEYIDGRDLQGALLGEEIIVFGSGESINTGISKIQESIAKPWVIACGSSLPLLIEKGIIPDFFVMIDPDVDAMSYSCLLDHSIPTFFQFKAHRDLLALCKGLKICMGTTDAWDIEKGLCKKVGIDQWTFDTGNHAGNFGAHIAFFLGCRTITLVGMDAVIKEHEEATLDIQGKKSKGDLLYGLEFFKMLDEQYQDQELYQYSHGLYFDEKKKRESLIVASKRKELVLPPTTKTNKKKIQKDLASYFSQEVEQLFTDFFSKEQGQAQISYFLANLSLFPIYHEYFMQMKEIFFDLFGKEKEDPLFTVTFFQMLWQSIYGYTGWNKKNYFLLGKEEGETFCYDRKGQVTSLTEKKGGKRWGKYTFYKEGKPFRKGKFVIDVPHGVQKTYIDEVLVDQTNYYVGKKVGIHQIFTDEGKMIEQITYHGDLFDKESYDEDGNVSFQAIWKEDALFETFYEQGKIALQRKGMKEGQTMHFEEIQ